MAKKMNKIKAAWRNPWVKWPIIIVGGAGLLYGGKKLALYEYFKATEGQKIKDKQSAEADDIATQMLKDTAVSGMWHNAVLAGIDKFNKCCDEY